MKPSIEERMLRQIGKTRKYNGMFDAAVTSVETTTATTSVETMDNQYTVTKDLYKVYIQCTDNDYSTIIVSIDYETQPGGFTRVADLSINADGVYEENYHSIPRPIRTTVFNIVNNVIDDVIAFIEEFDPDADPSSNEE